MKPADKQSLVSTFCTSHAFTHVSQTEYHLVLYKRQLPSFLLTIHLNPDLPMHRQISLHVYIQGVAGCATVSSEHKTAAQYKTDGCSYVQFHEMF